MLIDLVVRQLQLLNYLQEGKYLVRYNGEWSEDTPTVSSSYNSTAINEAFTFCTELFLFIATPKKYVSCHIVHQFCNHCTEMGSLRLKLKICL